MLAHFSLFRPKRRDKSMLKKKVLSKKRVLDVDDVFKFESFDYNNSVLEVEYNINYPTGQELGTYLNRWPLFDLKHKAAEEERVKRFKKTVKMLSY